MCLLLGAEYCSIQMYGGDNRASNISKVAEVGYIGLGEPWWSVCGLACLGDGGEWYFGNDFRIVQNDVTTAVPGRSVWRKS